MKGFTQATSSKAHLQLKAKLIILFILIQYLSFAISNEVTLSNEKHSFHFS